MEQLTFTLPAADNSPVRGAGKKGRGVRRRIDDGGRECGRCDEYKPWDGFHVSRTTAYGHVTICKTCVAVERHEQVLAQQALRKALAAAEAADVPVRLCGCGCGEPTELAECTRRDRGVTRGQPLRFRQGHNGRRGRIGYLRQPGGNLKSLYGITFEQYSEMVAMQCGQCAICGETPGADPQTHKKTSKLVVDHDHETGKVRALLCSRCNLMLGKSGDNPARLLDAAMYLATWKQGGAP